MCCYASTFISLGMSESALATSYSSNEHFCLCLCNVYVFMIDIALLHPETRFSDIGGYDTLIKVIMEGKFAAALFTWILCPLFKIISVAMIECFTLLCMFTLCLFLPFFSLCLLHIYLLSLSLLPLYRVCVS